MDSREKPLSPHSSPRDGSRGANEVGEQRLKAPPPAAIRAAWTPPAPSGPPPLPGLSVPTTPPPMTAPPAPAPLAPPVPAPHFSTAAEPLPTIDEEDDHFDFARATVRGAPAWLVSCMVHMAAVILLSLFTFQKEIRQVVTVELGITETRAELISPPAPPIEAPPVVEIVEPLESITIEDLAPEPLAPLNELEDLVVAPMEFIDLETPDIRAALQGRSPEMRAAMVAIGGGSTKTEAAVERGLKWLKRQQRSDGSWSLRGPYSDGDRVENRVAATAMAMLAFQGAGHTHQSGEYRAVVAAGKNALLDMNKKGVFIKSVAAGRTHQLYSQAQATIALCELFGMTQDQELLKPAQQAVDYAAQIQTPQGGWRYDPGKENDTSVTGWFVMALQSARMAGLKVPAPTLERAGKWLDSVSHDGGAQYSYNRPRDPSPTMSAEGLLCRQYLGWPNDHPALVRGADQLLDHPLPANNVYYGYYATQMLHHHGGDAWETWNDVMKVVVPKQQVLRGKETGSWNPKADRWGKSAGRLYVTCLNIYMLEVYYRHLPLYSH